MNRLRLWDILDFDRFLTSRSQRGVRLRKRVLVGDPVLRFCVALDGEESEEFIEGIGVMKKHPQITFPVAFMRLALS